MLSACVLELGPELRPAIDLDALDAEGDLGDELVEEGCGERAVARPATRAKVHFATGS